LNSTLRDYLSGVRSSLAPLTGDPTTTDAVGYQIIDNLRQQQALSLAYFDVFWVFGVVAVVLIGFALLMRRSVAEKGSHAAAE
jgi:DHA2 family multidrug resistance protein